MLRRMQGPEEPAESGRLQEDGGSGAHAAEDTAAPSGEHGQAAQMLWLQQQVTRLHEAFSSQESRWAVAWCHLQSQIDALVRQNRELQDGLEALGPPREADAFVLGARRKLDALGPRRSPRPLPEPSSRKSPEPAPELAADAVGLQEDRAAAEAKGTCSLPCKGPEGGLLTAEQTDGSARCPPGTAKAQNPPGGPGSSLVDAQTEQEDKEGTRSPAGEAAQALGDGCETITFSKGTSKKTTVLRSLNGDVKKVLEDQRVVYHYAGAQITRTTYPNGVDVERFPNQQTGKHRPDGSKEIVFPDGTVKRLSEGREETVFPDGTVVSVQRNGDRTILLSNGQREIQTAGFKRREYPDGTIKTVYCTGYQETRSASGTVKIRPPRT